jgi:hypothetical protein
MSADRESVAGVDDRIAFGEDDRIGAVDHVGRRRGEESRRATRARRFVGLISDRRDLRRRRVHHLDRESL